MLSARQRKLCKRLEAGRARLFRMAYAWSHNQDVADEVVQETMIKAMHNVDKVKNIDALDSWLFRVLSNCFIDLCRKRREEIDIDEVMLFEQDTPESVHLQNEMLVSVRSAIACLPIKHRQVITLIDIESFSYAEVASILDVPQGTIMSRLNRARQSLKKILDESQKENNNKTMLKVVR
ncbi:MAG: RNA polymerase sigma factor [Gammaproteobacteria bacterium]|nr:MAG: RNA polymerase sigma factor [Gammaproteobacteria bacterium]